MASFFSSYSSYLLLHLLNIQESLAGKTLLQAAGKGEGRRGKGGRGKREGGKGEGGKGKKCIGGKDGYLQVD